MARRFAIVAVLLLAMPACKFSRATNTADSASNTTEPTVEVLGDITTVTEETTTTVDPAATTTSRRVTTTARPVAAATTPRAATTRPPAPATPHCNASASDTYFHQNWTVYVTSTFPNSEVVISISWGEGNSGSYSGITDSAGSWTKSQPTAATMKPGTTVSVSVNVAGRVHCGTSFRVN
jgi:hypothetical protein